MVVYVSDCLLIIFCSPPFRRSGPQLPLCHSFPEPQGAMAWLTPVLRSFSWGKNSRDVPWKSFTELTHSGPSFSTCWNQ